MKLSKSLGLSLAATLLLVACGGGSDGTDDTTSASAQSRRQAFGALVSFGDSLSDVGTYTPATLYPGSNPPFHLGGKFTTNGTHSPIWVENVAKKLGLVVTPAEVGFAGQSVLCPAAASGQGHTCTAYGQGGARVTDPNGIRHDAGALTVPIKTQIANHLARFGRFTSRDLIILWAGANDLLWEMEQDPAKNPNSFVVRLFTAVGLLQAGAITPAEAQATIAAAQQASAAAMKTAGLQMTGYIRDEILAKGGRYVVVMNLPDAAVTPEGTATAAVSPILGAALTAFSDAFNQGLSEGLGGLPVRTIDARRLLTDVVARPASYEIVNASTPACDAEKMAAVTGGTVTDGFSLFCNTSPDPRYNGIRSGADVESWFFADGNHPTTGGYKVISNEVMRKLKSFGWLEDSGHEVER